MKYLILLISILVFISCKTDCETDSIKGDYTLLSYSKLDCDGNEDNLKWEGLKKNEDKMEISGILDITIFSLFTQRLTFHHDDLQLDKEVKIVGACTQIESNNWKADFSESPFETDDCRSANVTVDGNTLTWLFTDENGCEIKMIWEKK